MAIPALRFAAPPLFKNGCHYGDALSYDANGRDSLNVQSEGGNPSCYTGTWVDTRSYDAEDHITKEKCTGAASVPACIDATDTFAWGPRGELRQYKSVLGSESETSTLHWDGDELAVTTDSGNNATKYVEKLAVNSGNQLVMLDRDFAGESVEMHSKMGDTGVDVIPSYTISTGRYSSQNLTGTWPASGNLPGVGATIVPRKDGYLVGGLAIQGARAYDGELGQWITPDPYKGDVDSPMSQWGYQWNANNPITNSDASGLDSTSCNTGSAHTDQSSCNNDPWSCGGGYCENQAGDVEPECASASDIGCVTPPTVGQTSASTSTASTNPLTNGGAFDPLSLGFMLSLFCGLSQRMAVKS